MYRLLYDCLSFVEQSLVIRLLEMLEQNLCEQSEAYALAAAIADDDWLCHGGFVFFARKENVVL